MNNKLRGLFRFITTFGIYESTAANTRSHSEQMCLSGIAPSSDGNASVRLRDDVRGASDLRSVCLSGGQPRPEYVHIDAELGHNLTRLSSGLPRAADELTRCFLTIFPPLWQLFRRFSLSGHTYIRPKTDGAVEFHGPWTAICNPVDTWVRLAAANWRFRPRSVAEGPTQNLGRSQNHGMSRLLPLHQTVDERQLGRPLLRDQDVNIPGQHRMSAKGLSMIAKAGKVVLNACAGAHTQPVFSIFSSLCSHLVTNIVSCPGRSLKLAGCLPCCTSMTYNKRNQVRVR